MFEFFAIAVAVLVVAVVVVFVIRAKNKIEKQGETERVSSDTVEIRVTEKDLKIADFVEGMHGIGEEADQADEAAQEFLTQKELGNIEEAGEFGRLMAERLWEIAQELIMNTDTVASKKISHQQIVLLCYAVNAYISNESPNKLLAETANSVFFDHAEELSETLYKHVSDTAAFSMYILGHRKNMSDDTVGRIYAKLCDREGDIEKVEQGKEIYRRFSSECEKVFSNNIRYKV